MATATTEAALRGLMQPGTPKDTVAAPPKGPQATGSASDDEYGFGVDDLTDVDMEVRVPSARRRISYRSLAWKIVPGAHASPVQLFLQHTRCPRRLTPFFMNPWA